MAIHTIPQYRYSLFEKWSKDAFLLVKKTAKLKVYPQIIGSDEEINKFLVAMIRTQKSLHNWNDFLVDVLKMVKRSEKIDCQYFFKKYQPESISKAVPKWVTYKEDKVVSDFIDKLGKKKIKFIGTNQDKSEFVLRFILGQLGHDWEATIMMIWEMLGESSSLSVKKLNKEMKDFDYLKLFR